MADVLDKLADSLTPNAISSLATALDIEPKDATALTKAILPVLLERLQQNAKAGDAENIATAVSEDHDGSVLDVPENFLGGAFKEGPGVAILGHIFGDQVDTAVSTVAGTTGLPDSVVKMGFSALAPLAMGALTKAAIGAVTAVVVIKLLDVAVDQFQSGKAQQTFSRINASLDEDNDGSALDDVGRKALDAGKKASTAAIDTTKKVVTNPKVKDTANQAGKAASKAGRSIASTAKKRFGRFFN